VRAKRRAPSTGKANRAEHTHTYTHARAQTRTHTHTHTHTHTRAKGAQQVLHKGMGARARKGAARRDPAGGPAPQRTLTPTSVVRVLHGDLPGRGTPASDGQHPAWAARGGRNTKRRAHNERHVQRWKAPPTQPLHQAAALPPERRVCSVPFMQARPCSRTTASKSTAR
jgi:hypothetical protein